MGCAGIYADKSPRPMATLRGGGCGVPGHGVWAGGGGAQEMAGLGTNERLSVSSVVGTVHRLVLHRPPPLPPPLPLHNGFSRVEGLS